MFAFFFFFCFSVIGRICVDYCMSLGCRRWGFPLFISERRGGIQSLRVQERTNKMAALLLHGIA